MGNILFTWELGGGLGHLMQIQPLAKAMGERGHKVFAALTDLSRARSDPRAKGAATSGPVQGAPGGSIHPVRVHVRAHPAQQWLRARA